MKNKKTTAISTGVLTYNQKDHGFMLNDILLQNGDEIAIEILGYWIFGHIQHDAHGWYLLTSHHVGIRLYSGLTARHQEGLLQNVS